MNLHAQNWLNCLHEDAESFSAMADDCAEVQNSVLKRILRQNEKTVYGRKYGFERIGNYKEFTRTVPTITYEDLTQYIGQIKNGHKKVLSIEDVIRFEKTSGSSGTNKYIPYTKALISDFQKGVAPWMYSIADHKKAAFKKKFYLALSPKMMSPESWSSPVKLGSGDDLAYFEADTAAALYPCVVIPDTSGTQSDKEFYMTSISSLMKEKLSLISCWSPTYLLQIDTLMRRENEYFGLDEKFVWKDIWPDLSLVSCWTGASSAMFIEELQERLGESVEIQGKGLMSTECICSIPFKPELDPVLTYTSHFYEFEDDLGTVSLAHELKVGEQYSIIVTTSGGLYRYKTGDSVRVTGFYKSIPAFKFLGRQGRISDLVGEKLSEAQVSEAIHDLGLPPSVLIAEKDHYQLVSEQNIRTELIDKMDELLKQNCYYDQARKLSQLKSISFKSISKNEMIKIQQVLSGGKTPAATQKFHSLILFSEWQRILSTEVL